jgi:hypothetical protein
MDAAVRRRGHLAEPGLPMQRVDVGASWVAQAVGLCEVAHRQGCAGMGAAQESHKDWGCESPRLESSDALAEPIRCLDRPTSTVDVICINHTGCCHAPFNR